MLSRIVKLVGREDSRPLTNDAPVQSDVVFQPSVAFSLQQPGQADVLTPVLFASGIELEVFHKCSALAEALARRMPDIVFLDVTHETNESIEALFALAKVKYASAVQLIFDYGLPLIDCIKQTGQCLELQMLPPLARPFDDTALITLLESEGLRLPETGTSSVSLDEVMRSGWLEFWYQPKIALAKKQIVGIEAFARVRHPQRGVLSPGSFLKGAETRVLNTLNERALVSALRTAHKIAKMKVVSPRPAVNVSLEALEAIPIRDIIQHHRAGVKNWPGLLFDVTEEQVARDIPFIRNMIAGLTDVGVNLAIDDFGSGRLSLPQLRELPFAELKLNRRFVADCGTNPTKAMICKNVIDMVHSVGNVVVAIGVERADDLYALQRMGCDIGQGFLFGAPMPNDLFLSTLQERVAKAEQDAIW
jgi:EAL domain-containing protein (putative c-di-GMP-specific phosphodiesterase class I)